MSQQSTQWRVLKAWAKALNSNLEWTAALNAALDEIGFTADYVREAKHAAASARPKAIKDSVWGMVELTPAACMLLDSPLLQRLRFIKQLGFSYLTYPNATHTRFEHSLGTYWIARRLLDSAQRLEVADSHMERTKVRAICPPPQIQDLMCATALLHDIGHGPFSHALERVVEENPNSWKLGPFTKKQFTDTLRQATMEVTIGSTVKEAVPVKDFCELFAAAIVVSQRFQEFYEVLPFPGPRLDAESAVLSLASLLLGTPIETNAPGMPNVISGPIDADKLDYIVRDAQACGITISLDISRVLFKAGFYRLSDRSQHPQRDALKFEDGPVDVFVVEQSGADGLRELAMSRLSLYSRVYYHQCTRNAEQVFARSLHAWCKQGPADFFDAWKLGDEEFLALLRRNKYSGPVAQRLWRRHLPKRALALNADCYIHMDAPVPADILELMKTARKDPAITNADNAIDGLFSQGMRHPYLAAQINDEFASISKICQIDVSGTDAEWHTVPAPRQKDPTGTALCLSEDRTVETAERHLQQFIKSGEFPLARRYLFSAEAARIGYALAVHKVLHRQGQKFGVPVEGTRLQGWFNPIIDLAKSCLISKVPKGNLDTAMLELSRAGYYDDSPRLVSFAPPPTRLQALTERLSNFHGGFGWKVNSTFITRFVEQFPPKLREGALTLLESLHVEDWRDFAAKTRVGIDQIIAQLKADTYWIVPLSFTSGTQICKALRETTAQLSHIKIEQDLSEAIRRSNETDAIIFVDDNIASGAQAETAMNHLAGQNPARREPSTYGHPLSGHVLRDLKLRSLGFAFAWGKKTGIQRLVSSCKALGFRIDNESAVFISPLVDERPAVELPDDLKSFLSRVGMQLVANDERLDGQTDKDEAYALGADRALGYGNAQGRLVGSYGVPSSTYTALFMPGMISHRFERPWTDDEYDQAWLPLFLRSQKAHRLVVA